MQKCISKILTDNKNSNIQKLVTTNICNVFDTFVNTSTYDLVCNIKRLTLFKKTIPTLIYNDKTPIDMYTQKCRCKIAKYISENILPAQNIFLEEVSH